MSFEKQFPSLKGWYHYADREESAITIGLFAFERSLLDKQKVKEAIEELVRHFDSAGYLQHEQRYKASCEVDKVLIKLGFDVSKSSDDVEGDER